MCPPAIGAPPFPSPFLGLDISKPTDALNGDKTQGPDKLNRAAAKENVIVSRSEGGASGSGPSKATASLTMPPKLPSDGDGISASIQRLVKSAGGPMKDGLADSLLAKMLSGSTGEHLIQTLHDIVAARQAAESGSKAPVVGGFKPPALGGSNPSILGNTFEGAGQYASITGPSQAQSAQADQKTDEANAQQAEMVADRKKDTLEKLDELVKQVIDFLHDFQETNNDMMAAITRA